MILVIDNYDSFTYNLVQYLGELGEEVTVRRNDEIDIEGIKQLAPDHILISPGPCTPNEAGISLEVIEKLKGVIPIFGVCLGHQAIGQSFGGRVIRAERLMHGKTSPILHNGTSVFEGLPSPFTATRYHSLLVERESLPDCLEITAETEEGEIMGLRHKEYEIEGVQFHPESIITDHGHQILRNFLSRKAGAKA
ncbi:aminodeoxychorismate/anthranilate synthase component II [Paenibacillus tuaregi]|uniref:aminodeoxychorismate/anthranilate synthase component II n=1 Tax=Paenibacillus tuaregi TaxID=1816681 RepID=UPI000839B0E2|nr:aminodeoxychorismate/anthranilate synthase component II [Paenibacillus tuaregi]